MLTARLNGSGAESQMKLVRLKWRGLVTRAFDCLIGRMGQMQLCLAVRRNYGLAGDRLQRGL
jgi:hypothetical protein